MSIFLSKDEVHLPPSTCCSFSLAVSGSWGMGEAENTSLVSGARGASGWVAVAMVECEERPLSKERMVVAVGIAIDVTFRAVRPRP